MGNFSSSLNPGVALSRRSQVYAFALRVHFNEASQLRANVEDWNDAVRVRGDAREVDAVENGALQGPRLQEHLFCLPAQGHIAGALEAPIVIVAASIPSAMVLPPLTRLSLPCGHGRKPML